MASLRLERVSKSYDSGPVLDAVDLAVEAGEFLVIVGPSGCGKSTLLRIVAGLEVQDAGAVWIGDARVDELEPRERDVAMVFQNYALYPHMSVEKNLAFPLKVRGTPRAESTRRVAEAAELLGLTELLQKKPGTLSGGQMQRVALGRAIVRDPRLFLFDEPLSNLDAQLRGEMRLEIMRLHERLGITSLYVTHDQAEAMTMGSRVCVLDGGVVQQLGTPLEVYERPANRFVASFLGAPPMNLLDGDVEGGAFRAGAFTVPAPPAVADSNRSRWTLGIRPHELALTRAGEPAASELSVERVEHLGGQTHVVLRAGTVRLLAATEGVHELAADERVGVRPQADRLHWFDPETGRRVEP